MHSKKSDDTTKPDVGRIYSLGHAIFARLKAKAEQADRFDVEATRDALSIGALTHRPPGTTVLIIEDAHDGHRSFGESIASLGRRSVTVRHPLEAIISLQDDSRAISVVLAPALDTTWFRTREFFAFMREEFPLVRRIAYGEHASQHADALGAGVVDTVLTCPAPVHGIAEALQPSPEEAAPRATRLPVLPRGDKRSDQQLFLAWKGADRRAFEELYRRYRPRIRQLAIAMKFSVEDADEIVQETLLALFLGHHKFRDDCTDCTPQDFIVGLAARSVVAHLGGERRRARLLLGVTLALADRAERERRAQPNERLLATELAADVEAAVSNLQGRCRSAFWLRAVEGQSAKEAGATLGMTSTAVETEVLHAQRLIADSLLRASHVAPCTTGKNDSSPRREEIVVLDQTALSRDPTQYRQHAEALQLANALLETKVVELEERNRAITLLGQMSDLLQGAVNPAEAYACIADYARQLFPDDAGALCAARPANEVIEVVATWGKPATRSVFPPGDCLALRSGRAHAVRGDDDAAALCPHVPNISAAGYACMPIMSQGEPLGIVHFCWHPRERANGNAAAAPDFRTTLAAAFVQQVGLALTNIRLKEMLRSQATHDPLTGLYNRRFLEDAFHRELLRAARKGRPIGVLMLDLDHFKAFNDAHGHGAGDALLRAVAAQLRSNIRAEDIACRYGGEEFAVILPEATSRQALLRAEQIREEMRKIVVDFAGRRLAGVTVSIGVAALPDHGTSQDALLRAADAALYVAKANGRDQTKLAAQILESVGAQPRVRTSNWPRPTEHHLTHVLGGCSSARSSDKETSATPTP